MTAIFNASDFLHPLDFSARQRLEAVPMLRQVTEKYMGFVTDRQQRQLLLSHAIRLGPRQVPQIYRMLPPICDAFGIPEPELFLMSGSPNAETTGHSQTFIIIFNQMLEDLAEDEIQAVLAHECGHILAEHVLYRQMALALHEAGGVAMSLNPAAAALAALVKGGLQTALYDWYRKSELTADRAAATFMGTPEPMQRALFHILGAPKWMPGEFSYSEFAAQAQEFDEISTESSKWDRHLSRKLETGSTHPFPVIRMRELMTWSGSEAYHQLLGIAMKESMADRRSCTTCGQQLAGDWRFCQRCGKPVTEI